MTAASIVVRVAAQTLPKDLRARYREQWLADIRDAGEADIAPSEIAIGSISFAATFARPVLSGERQPDAIVVERRARLASALALSSAVIGMSIFASVYGSHGPTDNLLFDLVDFLSTLVLMLYLAVAPVAALVLVTTRGMPSRIRRAVCLLVLATLAGIAWVFVEHSANASSTADLFLTPGTAAYAGALLLSAIAGILLMQHFRDRNVPLPGGGGRRRVVAAAGAGVTLVAVALGLVNAAKLQMDLHSADVAFGTRIIAGEPDQAMVVSEMLARSEQATLGAVIAWGVIAALVTVVVAIAGFLWPRHSAIRALVLLCVLLISQAGVLGFIWLYSFGGLQVQLTVPESVLLLIGRWGLVAIILYAVGGVRFAGILHRSDTEGVPA